MAAAAVARETRSARASPPTLTAARLHLRKAELHLRKAERASKVGIYLVSS
jgi:hypothetical protein